MKLKNPEIKTIHYVALKTQVWREGRVKKLKFITIFFCYLILKKAILKKKMSPVVGHPLLDSTTESGLYQSNLGKNKALISIFAGSRKSEIDV